MMVRRKIQVAGISATGAALMLAVVPVAMCRPMPAQETEPASADAAKENTDYRKKSLSRLRKEFNDAEEEFYALFNSVNTDDEFDVDCRNEVALGSRRKVHACKADFLWKYEAEMAEEYGRRIDGEGGGSLLRGSQLEKKQELLRSKISSAISENPELQRSFAILARAKKDVDAKQRDR
jgi:hypothetical protein